MKVASVIDFQIDKIEMEFLHANWTSEFSHSLDPMRVGRRLRGHQYAKEPSQS